jgi:hypothetical protein
VAENSERRFFRRITELKSLNNKLFRLLTHGFFWNENQLPPSTIGKLKIQSTEPESLQMP